MEKKTLIKKFIKHFEKLLNEKDLEKQMKIAEEINDFCADINDEVEEKYWDEPIEDIQKEGLSLHHWKDNTGYCELKEKDIKELLNQLKKMLKSGE